MSHPADHRPDRRVVVPSGQLPEDPAVAALPAPAQPAPPAVSVPLAAPAPAAAPASGLHVCPSCRSKLVIPVDWEQAGPGQWAVTLQCPNCEWWDADLFGEDAVERFDEELDRGTEALVRDLMRLARANMEEDVERFLTALRIDAILPEDF